MGKKWPTTAYTEDIYGWMTNFPIFRYAKLREDSYLRRQDRYALFKYIARVLTVYKSTY